MLKFTQLGAGTQAVWADGIVEARLVGLERTGEIPALATCALSTAKGQCLVWSPARRFLNRELCRRCGPLLVWGR